MQKKSRASHKAVATKYWTEAESLNLPTRSVSLENALIRLDQLQKNSPGNKTSSAISTPKSKLSSTKKQPSKTASYSQKNMMRSVSMTLFVHDIGSTTRPNRSLHQKQHFSRINLNIIVSTVIHKKHPIFNNNKATKTGPVDILWKLPHQTSFFDLFKGADHNTTLLDSQKLQCLKASLKGDAAKLLSLVKTTDANYTVALKMVRDRYQNNRMIFRAHVNAIAVQKPLTQETAKDLRQLLETVDEHRLALENMKPVIQQYVFHVYLIAEKMPAETRKILETFNSWNRTSDLRRPQEIS